jgi:Holliday junction DNA helicase RuvA
VREDGLSLFGFSSRQEKEMFLKLISVSGVGPKMAIGVFSFMNVEQIVTAIATSDVKALSKAKGLGKKTAERIILELRERVGSIAASPVESGNSPVVVPVSNGDEDAVVALMTLGFKRDECARAIAKAREQGAKDVEEIIMLALKSM